MFQYQTIISMENLQTTSYIEDLPTSLESCLKEREKVTVFGDTYFYCFSGHLDVLCFNTTANCLPEPNGYFSSVYRIASSDQTPGRCVSQKQRLQLNFILPFLLFFSPALTIVTNGAIYFSLILSLEYEPPYYYSSDYFNCSSGTQSSQKSVISR